MRSPRVPGAVRFYLAFSAIVLILVAFEAFLTSLPFADAIPDYADQLQQRQLGCVPTVVTKRRWVSSLFRWASMARGAYAVFVKK